MSQDTCHEAVSVKRRRRVPPLVDLRSPGRIGDRDVKNRLYRAPVLEVAGNGPDAARILQRELEPSAASGCALVFQGACLVTSQGGRSAPGLSRVHDREFVLSLKPAVDAVKRHDARLLLQLGHGGLQCMELWHHAYRSTHLSVETLAVSEPPWWFRAMGRTPLLDLASVRVMEERELAALAEAFGRSAGFAAEAGYDGVHLAGANGSIFQQLWSTVFNKRRDSFGGRTLGERAWFFRLVVDSIRRHTPRGFLLTTKIPAETAAPFFVRGALSLDDGALIARIAEDAGVDAVVPVCVGVTRDQATARGGFPALSWRDPRYQNGYDETFGGPTRKRMVRDANRVAAAALPFKPAWNEGFCRAVKNAGVSIPVMCEGGLRSRSEMERVLDGAADFVGMGRPYYAEPRLAFRMLHETDAHALCANNNNCTIPQVTGAPGVCRTPDVMKRRGELLKQGVYGDRD